MVDIPIFVQALYGLEATIDIWELSLYSMMSYGLVTLCLVTWQTTGCMLYISRILCPGIDESFRLAKDLGSLTTRERCASAT